MRWLRPIFVKAALAVCLAAVLVAWGSFACWPVPEFCGRLMARVDLAHGRYLVLTYGLPVPWRARYARILHRRYGVELRVMGGSAISDSASDFSDGYDRVSTEAIRRRFGRHALAQAYAEARFGWEEHQVPMDLGENGEETAPGPHAVPGAFRSASPSGRAISTRWAAMSMLRR